MFALKLANLKTQVFGQNFLYFSILDSTNEYLLRELKRTKKEQKEKREEREWKEGMVVLAEEQKKGRGRLGRTWFSQKEKSLSFSILLVPNRELESFVQIPQISALSICQVLEEFHGLKPQIKWPNDILLRDKKIAGILCEMTSSETTSNKTTNIQTAGNRVVLGIGINVLQDEEDFPLELRSKVSSLFLEKKESWSREKLLCRILLALESNYQKWQNSIRFPFREYFLRQLRKRFSLYKKKIRIKTGHSILEGEVLGLDENGFLLLESLQGQVHSIVSGEILSGVNLSGEEE